MARSACTTAARPAAPPSPANRFQSPHASGGTAPADDLQSLTADDGRAGCAMGVALALVLLFGLGMAVVTVLVSIGGMPQSDE